MGNLPPPLDGVSTALYLGLIAISTLVNLAGVLVALDARDRGMNKFTAVIWYFAVIALFGLPAVLYLFLRKPLASAGSRGQNAAADSQPAPPQRYCPYCGQAQEPDSKICPACRKLL